MASWKIPAGGSDFSICLGMNESLGFSFSFTAFEGILGKFSVLVVSYGSDFVAIQEEFQEKLDLQANWERQGVILQPVVCLRPGTSNQPHPRLDRSHYPAIGVFSRYV